MAEYVLTIVTSKRCPKCLICKATGTIFETEEVKMPIYENPKTKVIHRLDLEFFHKVLDSGKTKAQEIVFESNDGQVSDVIQINTFDLNGDGMIVQKEYSRGENGRLTMTTLIEDQEDKKNPFKETRVYLETFDSLARRMVMPEIYGYIYFLPGFMISTIEEWGKGVKGEVKLPKIYSIGAIHMPILDRWTVDKSSEAHQRTGMMDPLEELKKIWSGQIDLNQLPLDPERDEVKSRKLTKFVSYDTKRGSLRLNDGDVPFSNGMRYRYVPSDFIWI